MFEISRTDNINYITFIESFQTRNEMTGEKLSEKI